MGTRALVGAGSVVRAETTIAEGHLAVGNPVAETRPLDEQTLRWKANGVEVYQELATSRARASVGERVPQEPEALEERTPDGDTPHPGRRRHLHRRPLPGRHRERGPLTFDPATPDETTQVADSGSASSLSYSGGSSNVLGAGSRVSQLLSAGLCTMTDGTWVPVFDVSVR